MYTHGTYRFFLFVCVLFILVTMSACGSATPVPATAAPIALPSATAAAAKAVTAPTATLPPPTATSTTAPSPTATKTPVPPTATTLPSATPTLGLAQDGLSAWCMPENSGFTNKTLTDVKAPSGAKIAELKDGALEIRNLPVSACAFLYTFNQPAPTGLKLELYELSQTKPWLVAELQPVEGSPNTLAAILYHSYVIAPPLWNVSFNFTVRDANGNALRQDRVNLHRFTPKMCWNGQYPNVYTLRCPKPLDLHPWDPSYRTPVPTFAPGDDPEKGF